LITQRPRAEIAHAALQIDFRDLTRPALAAGANGAAFAHRQARKTD